MMRHRAAKSSIHVQHVRAVRRRQALRTRPCPKPLAELIKIANLVSPEYRLPGVAEMLDSEQIVRKIGAGRQPDKAGFESIRGFLERNFPPKNFPQLYRLLGPIRLERVLEVFNGYRAFSSMRALLTAIANSQGGRIELPYEAAEQMIVLAVDSNGKIQVKPGLLLETVNGVEAGRIRQCSECKHIFWAGRMDKFACTRQCGQRRRVRLWRERYAEHYKLQRVSKADSASYEEKKRVIQAAMEYAARSH